MTWNIASWYMLRGIIVLRMLLILLLTELKITAGWYLSETEEYNVRQAYPPSATSLCQPGLLKTKPLNTLVLPELVKIVWHRIPFTFWECAPTWTSNSYDYLIINAAVSRFLPFRLQSSLEIDVHTQWKTFCFVSPFGHHRLLTKNNNIQSRIL